MLIIYVVAFIAIFYFMAIRPQQKQRRAHQALLSSLKKGDQIVTAAVMYGTVKRLEDNNIVVVEIAKGVTIKIARNAVSQIIRDKDEARAAAPEPRGKAAPAEIEAEASEVQETEAAEAADAAADTSGEEETAVAEGAEEAEAPQDSVIGRISRRRK
jgi:preprotein translocase subunit YajC